MKTRAVRLYGVNDLRLEEFELPPLQDDQILARMVSDSICMSSHKAVHQGPAHKRVPRDVDRNPVIIGHEFCGEIMEVGAKWRSRFTPGRKFSIQPALNYRGSLDAPGYSYRYIGGDATYVIIPNEVMECDCLLDYSGEGYFPASLSEPMSCIIGACNANYHSPPGSSVHTMGIRPRGRMALLAGGGPMGLGVIDFALHAERRPGLLVVTDIDATRLERAESLFPPAVAKKQGVQLIYRNTASLPDPAGTLRDLSGGEGFDDVLVLAPVAAVVELGGRILARDGCLNFFAGPNNPEFRAPVNFYNVHYAGTHFAGTSGGNSDDMREALRLLSAGVINPAVMVTHVGGLDAVIETTLRLPEIPGGKKLIYTNILLPLTALADFPARGQSDPRFRELAAIVERKNGLWSVEAEQYLLAHVSG
jgi:threonine dehydrogenase-like Zn-dependent dehydrogenase